jgi:hypothetical protein
MDIGATQPQALKTAYRVQLVRDAADKPADIYAVIDRLSAQGKQGRRPVTWHAVRW